MRLIIIIGAAFLLDFIFGDPQWIPHPICLIGNMISKLEKGLIKLKNKLMGGVFLVLIVISVCYLVPFTMLWAAGLISPYLSLILEILFCYQIFAARSLKTESMKVYPPLTENSMEDARKWLSYIVGRDTAALDSKGVIKGTVETVAENTTDGVIAPLIFMAIGGAPLAFLYKGINTMDSMVGYRNDKYIKFGKCAARLDDVANFIPARATAVLMMLGALITGMNFKNAVRIFIRDRKNHKSPNSAQTESVCAGALGIQLAGDACYFGEIVKKPTIGDSLREPEPRDIIRANRLMYVSSTLGVVLSLVILGVFL